MALFEYKPLEREHQEVRILELCVLPHKSEHLCCKISHARLQEIEYQAISYVWGSAAKPFSIEVISDTNENAGRLPLTSNLNDALQDLWGSTEITSKIFWIDQICINQNDDVEKGHQVQLMGEIYTRAARVITYLGAGTVRDADAIELIHEIHERYEPNLKQFAIHGIRDVSGLRRLLPVVTLFEKDCDEATLSVVADMAFGEWAQRVWLVQENYLNLETVFLRGIQVMSWIAVGYIPVLLYLGLLRPNFLSKALGSRHAWAKVFECISAAWIRRVKMSFYDFPDRFFDNTARNNVRVYSNLRCYNPRDHIFAFLAMSSDRDDLGILPDYTKSVAEVFIDVSMRLIKSGDLGLFYQISSLDNMTDLSTPSWSLTPSQVNLAGNGPWTNCHAHPVAKAMVGFDDTGRVLVCKGRIIDKVLCASQSIPLPGSAELTDDMEASDLPELFSYAQAINYRKITEDTLLDVLAVVVTGRELTIEDARGFAFIITNNWFAEEPRDDYRLLNGDQIKEGLELMSRIQQLASPPSIVDDPKFKEFLEAWNTRVAYGRKLGFSGEGRSFNANAKTQEGDVIAVIQGANSPFVLRPWPGSECYQLVGDVWLNGVMQGELYAGEDFENVDFDIRLV